MSGYDNTKLWQLSFGKSLEEDVHSKQRDILRVSLESFREKATLLAGEINRDLPDYTMHDITHIDSLWDMASLICGENYVLNPAEAFVLGGAFLIHDLGMGLAAYPAGLSAIKETTIWNDTYAYYSKKNGNVQDKDIIEIVLRALHAKHAEKLAFAAWGDGEEKESLIDNVALRDAYGAVIGKIAHSHWWDSSELLPNFANKLGALENMPNDWDVDPLKLACIMRVADASHIDGRRAPSFLKKIRNLSGTSESHWRFQQKLYQPRLEREKLVYTSKSPFKVEEAQSWWLCLDTLKMIDLELYHVDSILHSNNRIRFSAKGVAGVDHLRSIERLLPTSGWEPVDAQLHVGNITKLVESLGGPQLYGDNAFVPLRELIQNGCDAIRARRLLENDDDYGKITVRFNEDEKGMFLEVEDDGVGMSTKVLTGPFLDFGTSFWNSSMMHEELPGLESKGYHSTGKFGVGFFSVFMWGGDVEVSTRRYEDSRQSTKILSFSKGSLNRPLLRNSIESEFIRNGGTKVRVYFDENFDFDDIFKKKYSHYSFEDLITLIEVNFPSIDVTIFVEDHINGAIGKAITSNDWKTLSNVEFVNRLIDYTNLIQSDELNEETYDYILRCASNLSYIEENGILLGRGFLIPSSSKYAGVSELDGGAITIGGCRADEINDFIGILIGDTTKASRDFAVPIVDDGVFKQWMKDQSIMLNDKIGLEEECRLSGLFATAGIEIDSLKIARTKDGFINSLDLEKIIIDNDVIYIASDYEYKRIFGNFRGDISFKENLIFLDENVNSILRNTGYSFGRLDFWPGQQPDFYLKSTLMYVLFGIIEKHWGVTSEKLIIENGLKRKSTENVVIGSSEGVELIIKANIFDKSVFLREA